MFAMGGGSMLYASCSLLGMDNPFETKYLTCSHSVVIRRLPMIMPSLELKGVSHFFFQIPPIPVVYICR